MGGFNIRTKYTGQDKHIQQDRDEKNKLRRQRQDEQNKRGEEEETRYEREYMAETRQTLTQLKQKIKIGVRTATTATTTTARRRTTDTDRRTIYGKTGRHGNTDERNHNMLEQGERNYRKTEHTKQYDGTTLKKF